MLLDCEFQRVPVHPEINFKISRLYHLWDEIEKRSVIYL